MHAVQSTKNAKVFTLELYPLYGSHSVLAPKVICCHDDWTPIMKLRVLVFMSLKGQSSIRWWLSVYYAPGWWDIATGDCETSQSLCSASIHARTHTLVLSIFISPPHTHAHTHTHTHTTQYMESPVLADKIRHCMDELRWVHASPIATSTPQHIEINHLRPYTVNIIFYLYSSAQPLIVIATIS